MHKGQLCVAYNFDNTTSIRLFFHLEYCNGCACINFNCQLHLTLCRARRLKTMHTHTHTHTIHLLCEIRSRCTSSYTLSTLQFKRNLNGSYKGMCEKERMRWREKETRWGKRLRMSERVYRRHWMFLSALAIHAMSGPCTRFACHQFLVVSSTYTKICLLCVTECNMMQKNVLWSTRILIQITAGECTHSTDRNTEIKTFNKI